MGKLGTVYDWRDERVFDESTISLNQIFGDVKVI